LLFLLCFPCTNFLNSIYALLYMDGVIKIVKQYIWCIKLIIFQNTWKDVSREKEEEEKVIISESHYNFNFLMTFVTKDINHDIVPWESFRIYCNSSSSHSRKTLILVLLVNQGKQISKVIYFLLKAWFSNARRPMRTGHMIGKSSIGWLLGWCFHDIWLVGEVVVDSITE
jgi:hypothetical protein